jgi:hypothetical protein
MFQPCFPHLFKHDNAQLGDSEKIFPQVSQHLSTACDEVLKNILKIGKTRISIRIEKELQRP